MVDVVFWAALALLVLGVIGSVAPLLPGALFSIAGVLLYWWSTGYTEPGIFFMSAALIAGALTLLVDYAAGAISATVGGASVLTSAVAAIVGVVFLFTTGPVGMIAGVAATVFIIESYRSQDTEKSLKAALYATIGMLASAAVQALITFSILIGFLIAVAL